MEEFDKKNYIVVGATSGIGKETAIQLAEKGANLLLIARNAQKLEDLAGSLVQGKHFVLPADVAEIATIAPAVKNGTEACGKIDGMIFCVGEAKTARLKDLRVEDMNYAMSASFYSFLEFVKCLNSGKPKSQAMRIVVISSLASTEFQKYLTLYAAAKAALESAIRCLAAELGPRNIRINAIRPAFVDTPRLHSLNDVTGNIESSLQTSGYQPLGLISPRDVATLALFLLSDAAKAINGVAWPINGGAAC